MQNNIFGLNSLSEDPDFDLNAVFDMQGDFFDIDYESETRPYDFNTKYCDEEKLISYHNKYKLSTLSLNIQSLQSKFQPFCELIGKLKQHKKEPDIILLQELWSVPDFVEFKLQGYHPLIYKTRIKDRGGGVGIFLKDNFTYKKLENSIFVERVLESIFIELKINNTTIFVGSVYHPPNSPNLTTNEHLAQFMELMGNLTDFLSSKNNVFIYGDLNLDCLLYNKNKHVTELIDLMFSYGFLQTINKPTRVTSHSAKIIDYSLTNSPDLINETYLLISDLSDHFPVFQYLSLKTYNATVNSTPTQRNFSAANIRNFKLALSANDWTPITSCANTQEAYNRFEQHFNSLFNLFFPPQKRRQNKNYEPIQKWFTRGLLISRNTLQKRFTEKLTKNDPVTGMFTERLCGRPKKHIIQTV